MDFGRVEYLTNVYIGMVLFFLGIYILYHSIGKETQIPPLSLLWLLFGTIVLKITSIMEMYRGSKKATSKVLLTTAEKSKADLYSTIGVAIITIILQFSKKYPILEYVDILGSLIIAGIVFKTAFHILISNSLALIGEIDENKELINKVKEHMKKYQEIKDEDIYLIKYGSYYKLQLSLKLSNKVNLRKISKLEKEIKKEILRKRSFNIKYVTIYVSN